MRSTVTGVVGIIYVDAISYFEKVGVVSSLLEPMIQIAVGVVTIYVLIKDRKTKENE